MATLPNGWNENNDKLVLAIECDDFKQAVVKLNAVAEVAELLQHHPDITIQNYNELIITTSTHSENKITDKDYELAKSINAKLAN